MGILRNCSLLVFDQHFYQKNKVQMEIRVQITVLFCLLAFLCSPSPIYNTSQYSSGANLISNPQFLLPLVDAPDSQSLIYNSRIPGWGCQNLCQIYMIDYICNWYGNGCGLNYTRGLNLDSSGFNNVSQLISITTPNQYLITLKWVPAFFSSEPKRFKVEINQTAIIDLYFTSTWGQSVYTNQALVNLTAGNWLLNMRMYNCVSDSSGAVIVQLGVQELVSTTQSASTSSNSTTNPTNSTVIPANSTANTNNSTASPANSSAAPTNSSTANTSTPSSSPINSSTIIPTTPTNSSTNTPANSSTPPTNSSSNTAKSNSSTITPSILPQNSSYNPSSNYSHPSVPTNQTPTIKMAYFELIFESIMNNGAAKLINSIPGNRIFLNQLTQFLNIFDRLYLYYYHAQPKTQYADTFLQQIYQITNAKSSLCQLIFQMCQNKSSVCDSINQYYSYLLNSLNQKYNYTDSAFLAKNNNGIGFFANHLDFIYFQVPFSFLLISTFYLAFHLLFTYRISIVLRKYSLLATVLFVLFEGNVEEFAFYLFSELKYFFSINFTHKIANVVILYILFLMIIFSVAGLMWLKFHYNKLVKYFVEYYGCKLIGVVFQACQRMIFPLLLGFVHSFLMKDLSLQTGILIFIQLFYLGLRIIGLRTVKVREKLKVVLAFSTSFLRILFILTFYQFNLFQLDIINLIHRDIFFIYMGIWIIELSSNLLGGLVQILLKIKYFCSQKQNQNQVPKLVDYIKERTSRQGKIKTSQHKEKRSLRKKNYVAFLKTQNEEYIDIFNVVPQASKQKSFKTFKTFKSFTEYGKERKNIGIKQIVIKKGSRKLSNNKTLIIQKSNMNKKDRQVSNVSSKSKDCRLT